MKFNDHPDNKSRDNLKKVSKRKNKKKPGPYDNVDYKSLMGMDRTTYERRNGAIRRK